MRPTKSTKQTASRWRRLDNAAKLYPATSSYKDTKVFRFSCQLVEPVDPVILQTALDQTLEDFPFFRSVIKKGLFWYYFEESAIRPQVEEENRHPCSAIYDHNRKSLLFRTSYFGNRINVEAFHALTDGAGGIQFFRTLVLNYLWEAHRDELGGTKPDLGLTASRSQIESDSFSKYYSKVKIRRVRKPTAYRLKGERMPDARLGVIEGHLPVAPLAAHAKGLGATLTEYLVTLLICSIREGMTLGDMAKPVAITVPVNLRSYFPSETSRNFFSTISVGYDFRREGDSFDQVLESVRRSFAEQLTPESISASMNLLVAMEHSIPMRIIPLALKDPILKLSLNIAARTATANISNLGRISMPPEVAHYIKLFSVFNYTRALQACLCTYGDNVVISFTSPYGTTDVQRSFFRAIAALGIPVKITSSLHDAEEEADDAL